MREGWKFAFASCEEGIVVAMMDSFTALYPSPSLLTVAYNVRECPRFARTAHALIPFLFHAHTSTVVRLPIPIETEIHDTHTYTGSKKRRGNPSLLIIERRRVGAHMCVYMLHSLIFLFLKKPLVSSGSKT